MFLDLEVHSDRLQHGPELTRQPQLGGSAHEDDADVGGLDAFVLDPVDDLAADRRVLSVRP